MILAGVKLTVARRHPGFLTSLVFVVAVTAISGFAQVRREADQRITASLAEIARRPESRAELSVARREVYEPERVIRRRKATTQVTTAPRVPEIAQASILNVTPSYGGFAALADNFSAIPPDTEGAVGRNHVVT